MEPEKHMTKDMRRREEYMSRTTSWNRDGRVGEEAAKLPCSRRPRHLRTGNSKK
jgi:hypothetical protein